MSRMDTDFEDLSQGNRLQTGAQQTDDGFGIDTEFAAENASGNFKRELNNLPLGFLAIAETATGQLFNAPGEALVVGLRVLPGSVLGRFPARFEGGRALPLQARLKLPGEIFRVCQRSARPLGGAGVPRCSALDGLPLATVRRRRWCVARARDPRPEMRLKGLLFVVDDPRRHTARLPRLSG